MPSTGVAFPAATMSAMEVFIAALISAGASAAVSTVDAQEMTAKANKTRGKAFNIFIADWPLFNP
jgi:hypothetical protein